MLTFWHDNLAMYFYVIFQRRTQVGGAADAHLCLEKTFSGIPNMGVRSVLEFTREDTPRNIINILRGANFHSFTMTVSSKSPKWPTALRLKMSYKQLPRKKLRFPDQLWNSLWNNLRLKSLRIPKQLSTSLLELKYGSP